MKTKNNDIIMQNKIFVWIAAGTSLLLMVPLILMKLKVPFFDPGSGWETMRWGLFDFIIMGLLIFGTSSLFVLIARKIQKKQWKILAITLFLGFLWLWAELAVGIFTKWGD